MYGQFPLLILALFWLASTVVTGINISIIKTNEGANSPMFGLNFTVILLSFLFFGTYFMDIIKYEDGEVVDYQAPIPFPKILAVLVAVFIIVVTGMNLGKYFQSYQKDDSITDWKKSTFLYSNITIMCLALLEMAKHGHVLSGHLKK